MQTIGKSIGKTLVKLREERNLSAKDLAGIIKKSPSYISKLETGNVKNPKRKTLMEILTGMNVESTKIEEIMKAFYGEEVSEIEKVDNVLMVKTEKEDESNNDFIENFPSPTSQELSSKTVDKFHPNEEIIYQFYNRNDLSLELTTIAHQLHDTAIALNNRSKLDVRYDSIKLAVNQATDRLEIFKVNYDMYVEKLIREGNKINC